MTKNKRLLSILLSVVMAFSLFATTACAAETQTNGERGSTENLPTMRDTKTVDVATLIEKIAAEYAAKEYPGDWQCFDMAAYAELKTKEGENEFHSIKDTAYVAYMADAYTAITREGATVTDIAKAEVILNVLGIDSSNLVSGENVAVNNREKIREITEYQTYSDAIWMLFAGEQGTVKLSPEQVVGAVSIIEENANEDGLLFGIYGGYTYTDIDSTGWAVAALSPLARSENDSYGVKKRVQVLIESMLHALSTNQQENGSYGNTYTDASVICGLCGYGIDPGTDERFIKGENSLVDGLMSYLNETKDGFSSGYSPDTDSWATEQAFRALVAYRIFEKGDGEAFNIFTYAGKKEIDNEKEPGANVPSKPSAGGLPSGTEAVPDKEPTEKEEAPEVDKDEIEIPEENITVDNKITVSFQMKTHKKTWIGRHSVTVEKGSTVANLISTVFAAKGAKGDGISSGYLRSVTYQGETLAEFDVGKGSGWCYRVNGESPRVGINSYKLSDRDFVLLEYVADYDEEEEEPFGKTDETPDFDDSEEDTAILSEEKKNVRFSDLGNHIWAEDSINTLADKGIIKGTSETTFSPGNSITRADFAILLVRAFEKTSDNTENFSDVSEADYFAKELAIARNTGLVSGIGDNKFAPRSFIKRCDMMLMVYRVLKAEGIELEIKDVDMADIDSVPEYALDAVKTLISNGLVNGKNNLIAPNDNTTRAEVAVLIKRVLDFVAEK